MKEFILVHQPGSVEPTVIRKSLFDMAVSRHSELHGNHTELIPAKEHRDLLHMSVTESPDEIFKKLNEE